jgi:hypothetical protein
MTGRSFKATLERLSLGAIVDQLWRQRNELMHHNTPRTEESILAQIKWEVRSRFMAKGSFKCFRKNLIRTCFSVELFFGMYYSYITLFYINPTPRHIECGTHVYYIGPKYMEPTFYVS